MMDVALVGAELEENLGLRYMASALEAKGHRVEIIPFNSEADIRPAAQQILTLEPRIAGLSMVFTGRARQFCRLAQVLRDTGYHGHIVAGGHFASFNCERLLQDFPAFDSVALGEGENLICDLAEHLDDLMVVPGLCYRRADGSIGVNPSGGNPDKLDELPFPKRGTFHDYYGQKIASVLTSRGCWRDCAFCSINAWYQRGGGKKFRIRSINNLVAELTELYHDHGVRIFNFQDDNFFLPNPDQACRRFETLRDGLRREGVEDIAIAVKARPDSITRPSIAVLDDLGLFRVFLGVENYSETGLRHLNRKCSREEILRALEILNDFDVHVAYNLLMFEPDTVLDDILINLRFMERHNENPFNFCRAEAYAGTGLEAKLVPEGRLLGDYFGFDYRLKDPRSEAFHQIANHAFFDRNFSDHGLHYFNMEVDFCFQLLRRFYPRCLSQTLRGSVRNFIKETNLDTYRWLCRIYDFVAACDPADPSAIRSFAWEMRQGVDAHGVELHTEGEALLQWLDALYEQRDEPCKARWPEPAHVPMSRLGYRALDESGVCHLGERTADGFGQVWDLGAAPFGTLPTPVPYDQFKKRMAEACGASR
jgi:hypothetical protein